MSKTVSKFELLEPWITFVHGAAFLEYCLSFGGRKYTCVWIFPEVLKERLRLSYVNHCAVGRHCVPLLSRPQRMKRDCLPLSSFRSGMVYFAVISLSTTYEARLFTSVVFPIGNGLLCSHLSLGRDWSSC